MAKLKIPWLVLVAVLFWPVLVAATSPFKDVPCSIINQVYGALNVVAPTLMVLMFTYGAVKYIWSAEDPGGRKTAKSICIAAVMGGIIFILVWGMYNVVKQGWWDLCEGVVEGASGGGPPAS
ncbi:MAG: hypothetical protein V1744_00535 [Candidatus Altiarchaeota archaeon]